jgi:hypothetical protein
MIESTQKYNLLTVKVKIKIKVPNNLVCKVFFPCTQRDGIDAVRN